MTVWESIALHTTPEVPRYKQPEVRLVTMGVEYHVLGFRFNELLPSSAMRSWLPIHEPASRPGSSRPSRPACATSPTTFGTMNTDILEATVPGYVRPNFCDYIRDSRFDT